jgi:hypothetical protein
LLKNFLMNYHKSQREKKLVTLKVKVAVNYQRERNQNKLKKIVRDHFLSVSIRIDKPLK